MEIKISKEDLQKKSLFVATPMYGGQCHGLYMKAALDLQGLLNMVFKPSSLSYLMSH
jgi:hypothetical protein